MQRGGGLLAAFRRGDEHKIEVVMIRHRARYILLLVVAMVITSCNVTRSLPEGVFVYCDYCSFHTLHYYIALQILFSIFSNFADNSAIS